MAILITGGAGFIGSHLAEYSQGRAEVRVFDHLHPGKRSDLQGLKVDLSQAPVLGRKLLRTAMQGPGSRSIIRHGLERLGDVRHSRARVGKLRASGFRSSRSLRQGMAETAESFRATTLRP